ncbi:Dynein Heavy Chain 11, Axonemal [Manis pentadactyla]|nr:Dynein Heavy Chain 11, Axonemal [Manis pentadactyla]
MRLSFLSDGTVQGKTKASEICCDGRGLNCSKYTVRRVGFVKPDECPGEDECLQTHSIRQELVRDRERGSTSRPSDLGPWGRELPLLACPAGAHVNGARAPPARWEAACGAVVESGLREKLLANQA